MKGLFSYVVIFFIFFSCSSNKKSNYSEGELKDLVESFDLDKNEFEKFKVSSATQVQVELVKKNTSLKQEKISKKPLKNKKNITIKKDSKKKEKVLVQKKQIEQEKAQLSLEDGPQVIEKFQKYDVKSEKIWSSFNPNVFIGEEQTVKIKYLGITVGNIKISTLPVVKINGINSFHFKGVLKSEKYYEMLYSLNDTIDTFVEVDRFVPIKYTLIQRESGKNIDDLQLFDSKKFKTFHWYKKVKKGKITKKEIKGDTPEFFQDIFSAVFFMRGLSLSNGSVYEFPIVTRGKLYLSKIKITGREKIKVMGKRIKAIKVQASNHFPGIVKKKSSIEFWFSDDPSRKLLKFNSSVKIGTVEGVLIDYKKGKRFSK